MTSGTSNSQALFPLSDNILPPVYNIWDNVNDGPTDPAIRKEEPSLSNVTTAPRLVFIDATLT